MTRREQRVGTRAVLALATATLATASAAVGAAAPGVASATPVGTRPAQEPAVHPGPRDVTRPRDVAAPAPTPPPASGRVMRSYQPSGEPVAGGVDPARAPALTPGTHLDRITQDQVLYYAVDVPVGGTAYVSATTVATSDTVDAIDVKHLGSRNQVCDYDTGVSSGLTKIVTAGTNWTPGGDDPCSTPGRAVFSVTRRGEGPPVPLEIVVLLESPPQDQGPAPGPAATYTEPGGPPHAVVGGGSFASATELPGSGHYTDTIAPDEWVFYKVRVEWGQSLTHQIRVGGGQGVFGAQAHFYNPVRDEIANDSQPVLETETLLYTHGGDQPVTRPVRYRNREDQAHPLPDDIPGWYYIAVHGSTSGEDVRTLYVDVSLGGSPEPGPAYIQGAAGTGGLGSAGNGPSGAAGSTPQATPGRTPPFGAAADGGGGPGPAVWIGVPAAILGVGALTTVYLRGRGRRANAR